MGFSHSGMSDRAWTVSQPHQNNPGLPVLPAGRIIVCLFCSFGFQASAT